VIISWQTTISVSSGTTPVLEKEKFEESSSHPFEGDPQGWFG
jgi:hypothetical protein